MAQNATESATNLRLNRSVVGRLNLLRDTPRRPGYHPSELHRMCPVLTYFREEARRGLASDDPRPHFEFLVECLDANSKKFPGRLRLEFEIGSAIHQQIQFHLGVNGFLYGRWKCPICGLVTPYGQMPRMNIPGVQGQPVAVGALCPGCNGVNRRMDHSWLYLEPRVSSSEWGVEGLCDGDLRVPRGDVVYECVLEIKSINEYGWAEGQKKPWEELAYEDGWQAPEGWRLSYPATPLPRKEHVLQASTYAWLMGRSWIYFIYVNKNQVNRWKEIMVPPNMEAVEEAKRKMAACTSGLERKTPPLEHRVCPDVREVTARTCPAVAKCFGCRPTPNLWDLGSGGL